MKFPKLIYETIFSALVHYELMALDEISNKIDGSHTKLKNIKLTFTWLKQFKKKDSKINKN
tara:strand:- start:100 stop:282 length:183 start_codon:yes stop_codon:yes gene_type:complete